MNTNDKNLLVQLGIGAGVLLALAVGWYLVSPLFINVNVDEGFPTAVVAQPTQTEETIIAPTETMEATAEVLAAATEAMAEAQETEMPPVEEPMPTEEIAEMVILVQGTFYDVAHHGSGTATIYQLADGSRILRFEDFDVLNGPDLHVYFTSEVLVADRVASGLENGYDLGKLKGNIGNQNYEIPADLDLSSFRSIVIWCEPFQVPFSAAFLSTP